VKSDTKDGLIKVDIKYMVMKVWWDQRHQTKRNC